MIKMNISFSLEHTQEHTEKWIWKKNSHIFLCKRETIFLLSLCSIESFVCIYKLVKEWRKHIHIKNNVIFSLADAIMKQSWLKNSRKNVKNRVKIGSKVIKVLLITRRALLTTSSDFPIVVFFFTSITIKEKHNIMHFCTCTTTCCSEERYLNFFPSS